MIKNADLRLRLIKSELVQIELADSEYIDIALFNKVYNVIIYDRFKIAQEIYKLIDYNPDELDELINYFSDKETIQEYIEQLGHAASGTVDYMDRRTVDYISESIREDLRSYFN